MIQDKIFFDEKDPTGLSYNTPFTYFGSYQGRLWSKAPGGEIKYYTQNSDLSVYAITGSNQFNGNQAITGSLTVTGGIIGTTATSSYVEYSNVANKPTLVSGSSQVSFNGIIDTPTLVSGSSQISFNGITNKPTLISGSGQIAALGYATTSTNVFQGNQIITGSLFITQNLVVAGSSSIQYITSSNLDIADNIITVNAFNPAIRFGGLAVIDSGSSPQVSGSLLFDSIKDQWIFVHQNQSVVTSSVLLMGPETYNNLGNESYISANRLPKGSGVEHLRDSNITDTGTVVSISSSLGVGTTNPDIFSRGDERNVGISVAGASDNMALQLNAGSSAGRGAQIYMGQGGTRHFTISSNATETRVGTATSTPLILTTNDTTRLTIAASTGAATFTTNSNSTISNTFQNTDTTNASTRNYFNIVAGTNRISLYSLHSDNNYINTAYGDLYFQMNASTSTTNPMIIKSSGNIGIGTTSPKAKLHVDSSIFSGGSDAGYEINGANSYMSLTVGVGISRGIRTSVVSNSGYPGLTIDNMSGTFSTSGLPSSGTYDTNLFYINGQNGNVGINNVGPVTKLTLGSYSGSRLPYINGTGATFSANGITVTSANSGNAAIGGGLDLTNNTYSVNSYSPIISFSSLSQSGAYNNAYAGIWGVLGGAGGDANWVVGALVFGTASSYGITEKMRIASDGNVLIGTTSNPGQKMHVYSSGTTRIRIDGAGNNSGVLLAESGTNKWSIASVSNDLVFYNEAASSTQMRIAANGAITTPFNLGKAYSQTSGAGTGTSIVDTGITYDTGDFGGYSRGATYQVVFNGNPNQGGSAAYFAQYTGIIMIYTGWNGSAVTTYIEYTPLAAGNNIGALTLTPRFWNGSSEVGSLNVYEGGYQIRLKISGYNSGYTGADQTVYLKKIS